MSIARIMQKASSGRGAGLQGAWDLSFAYYDPSESTDWDISTATFSKDFSVAGQDTTPEGVFFKPDGTKMYVVGSTGDAVYEYDVNTAWDVSSVIPTRDPSKSWDISTATYIQNASVLAEESTPTGVFFKPDGTKMYVIGQTGVNVNEYDLSTAWDVSSESFVQSFDVSAQETAPQGVFFKPDGTKMYVIGITGDDVNEYDLSTAWDISSASFVQNFSVSAQDTGPQGVFFKPDGTRMYVIGTTGDAVYEYDIGAPDFDLSSQDTSPQGVFFKPDGTKIYVVGRTGDSVYEYDLSTAWDLFSASYLQEFSVASEETTPTDVFFKPDGTKMYVVGQTGNAVNEYDLSIAWDVTSASYLQNFSVAEQENNPTDLFFKSDGSKMYVTGSTGDDVNEYDLSTAWDVSSASYLQNFGVDTEETNPTGMFFKPDGSKMYVIGASGDDVNQYDLGLRIFDVSAQEASPTGVFFKPDGTKMYVIGFSGDDVNEYDLSAAWDVTSAAQVRNPALFWDISTASYLQSFSVAGQDTTPVDVFFKPDGTKMYVVGASGDDVNEYDLGTAWDISSASYLQNFSVNAQEASPTGVFFKPDGTKMYVVGSSGDEVNEYDLSTAWDVTSASFVQSFDVSAQDTTPQGVFFRSDGAKMYVIGQSGDAVYEYDLSTAWDVSSAAFAQNFSVSAQETSPTGVFFKPDGTKMYVVGSAGDDINEYDLNADGFDISAQETTPEDVFFKPDGTKMYVIGRSADEVNEYDLSTAWDVFSASFVQNFSVSAQEANPTGVFFKPDGTKMYVIGYSGDDVNEYDLSTAWDISSASFVQNFSVSAQEPTPRDVFFRSDGLKMYVVGSSGDDVNEYDLSTAWDVSSASFVQSFDVSAQETNPQGVFFKPDGTKMYVVGSSGDDVNEYDLSTAWDVSSAELSIDSSKYWDVTSARFIQNFSVSTEVTVPGDVFFKSDGTKMYVVGSLGGTAYEYDLSTAWDISSASVLKNPATLWDISTASYLQNISVAGQDTAPTDVFFRSDGLKMYVIGGTGVDVNEYDLSTAWDVSSAAFVQVFDVSAQETAPRGVFFKPDGTKMYVIGGGRTVDEYNLGYKDPFDVSAQDTIPTGVFFKSDGTKMYVIGQSGDAVYEYDLAYKDPFDVSAQDTTPNGVFFKPDGTKMYVIGDSGNAVYEYDLSTAWDISSASYLQNFDVSAQETGPNGVFFKPDGTKMYVIGTSGDDVNEYDLSTAWDVTSAAFVQNFSVSAQDAAPDSVFFKPDGTKMYVTGRVGDDVYEYDLSTAWDVSSASYLQNFSVSAQESDPRGVFFKPDGTKMYVVGTSGDDVNEYDLSTAWDVSSASYLQNFSVSAQEATPTGVFFKSDGTKMYVIGSAGDDVNEYDLSTAWDISSAEPARDPAFFWDISTAFYLQNFSVSGQDISPEGVFFKPDGTKMYVVGSTEDDVYEYDLTTAWNVSSASYFQNFSVSGQETTPNGVFFKPDGTKMYVVGDAGNDVNEYDLSTAWDISSASFVQNLAAVATPTSVFFKPDGTKMYVLDDSSDDISEFIFGGFSVSAQDTTPTSVFFKPDGTKMYVAGDAGNDVNEYDIGNKPPFDVSAQETNPADVFFKPDGTKMYVIGTSGDDVNEYDLSTAWDVTSASYLQNFSVSAQETGPTGVFFKPDGTKMYVIGTTGDDVNEYDLSTAWDVSSATFVQSFDISAQEATPQDVFFKPDGTKMYVIGSAGDDVNEYDLSTAWDISSAVQARDPAFSWDISTASYLQNFSVGAQETSPQGVFFKPDGTKMYVVGTVGDDVNEYDLSTAWDISTASYLQNFSVSAQEAAPTDVFFRPDGTKMYVVGSSGRDVNEYDLSTAWDVSSASYLQNFSVSAQETSLSGVFFKSDGTKMYVIGTSGDDVNEYDLSTAWDVTSASYLQNFSVSAQDTTPAGVFFRSDGLKMYVVGDAGRDINEYDLSTAWDVSTATFVQSFDVSAQDTGPRGVFFKPDGTKMYVVGDAGDDVNEYNLSFDSFDVSAQDTAPVGVFFRSDGLKMYVLGASGDAVYEYDLSTAWDVFSSSFVQNFSVSAQESSPNGVFFKPDGTKMYVIGTTGDAVYEYDLSTAWDVSSAEASKNPALAWDVSTATFVQNFDVSAQETRPQGVFFKPDGTKMYVIGTTGDDVNEYDLGTAWNISTAVQVINPAFSWDISTASYLQNFSVGAQETEPQGVFFKPDGTKMYVVGINGDDVNEYDLSTAWDISSATFVQVFDVSGQDTTPTDVFFRSDGLKMYVVGDAGNDINEYDLSTAWDISSASYLQRFSVTGQGESTPTGVFFKPDGTKMYVIGAVGDAVYEYDLSTAWDISSATFVQSFDVSAQETVPTGVFFKPDGTRMYVVGQSGSTGDAVSEYNLSSVWDVTSATFVQSFDVSAQDTVPQGVFFKPDGTKMYVIGDSGNAVYEYDLSFDSFDISAQEATPQDVFFKPDGTKMYVIGSSGDAVYEYDLSTAWDIFSASYIQNFSLVAQETSPNGVFFKPDGTKMYVIGQSGDDVNEYDLSTAWDVSSASYLQNFSVSAQETIPQGVFFKPDGTRMYVIGSSGDAIFSYTLGPQP